MLRLLRLPNVVDAFSGPGFEIGPSSRPKRSDVLTGVLCAGVADARRAAADGAHFLLMSSIQSPEAIRTISFELDLPLYVRDLTVEEAWQAGATGIHTLPPH